MNLQEEFNRIVKKNRGIIYTDGKLTKICAHVLACINGNYPVPAREKDKIKTLKEFEKLLELEGRIQDYQISAL